MVIHKCDLCKEECDNITTIQVPLKKHWYAMNNGVKVAELSHGIRLSNIEICSTCAMHIAEFLDSYGINC